jgi:hypothetical protein
MKIETYTGHDGNVYIKDEALAKRIEHIIASGGCHIASHDDGDGQGWDEFELTLEDGTRVKGIYAWDEPGYRTLETKDPDNPEEAEDPE